MHPNGFRLLIFILLNVNFYNRVAFLASPLDWYMLSSFNHNSRDVWHPLIGFSSDGSTDEIEYDFALLSDMCHLFVSSKDFSLFSIVWGFLFRHWDNLTSNFLSKLLQLATFMYHNNFSLNFLFSSDYSWYSKCNFYGYSMNWYTFWFWTSNFKFFQLFLLFDQ